MAGRRVGWVVAALAVGALAVPFVAPVRPSEAAPSAPAQDGRASQPEDRYAMAGGCYVLRAGGEHVTRVGPGYELGEEEAAEPLHFQATDLGRYLLYDTDHEFVAMADGAAVAAPGPGPFADWVVDSEPGGEFSFTSADGVLRVGSAASFALERADGCAVYPEVEINVTGAPHTGESPYEEVRGYIDGHMHMMAFEFVGGGLHCGRPWHPYGVAHALVDCPDHEILDGAGAVLENFLSSGGSTPLGSHDPVGWPTFEDWPAPRSLTHEQSYYRWVERAWRGGLRVFVNLFVDNGVLCEVYPIGSGSCDEMDGVRLQAQRIRELERYIDAQSGGPGEGWFRIVTDPFQARRVANEGKLAVVLGIEVSELFGCSALLGQPQCTTDDIDRQLDEVHALGVRQLELVNKFDNALAGVAFDGGTTGIVVNTGNLLSTGRFWDMESCDHDHTGVHDNDQITVPPGELAEQDAIFGAVLWQLAPPGALPIYPEPHHCNTLGLTDLGHHTLHGIIQRQMLFDPDHMSVRARQESLDVMEMHQYSGVVSSHSWSTPDAYPRIYALGGMVTPYAGSSTGFVDAWRQRREQADPRFYWGIGWGADANGLGAQGSARGGDDPVTYPFEGLGGVTVDRQRSGQQVYDINTDGVAHYGLYPDWVEDVRLVAGDEIVEDLARGSEAYLQTWERAVGIPAPGCRSVGALDSLATGLTPEEVLAVAGQPARRDGTTFTYCVEGGGQYELAFGADGRLARGTQHAGAAPSSLPATGGGGQTTALLLGVVAVVLLSAVRRVARR